MTNDGNVLDFYGFYKPVLAVQLLSIDKKKSP